MSIFSLVNKVAQNAPAAAQTYGQLVQNALNGQGQPQTGAYAGDGGSSASDDANKNLLLSQLEGQQNSINQTLGTTDSRLNQGLTQLNDDFNKQSSDANVDRGRTLSGYATKLSDTNIAKENALGTVNDRARTLRNSVLQRIGQAAGSGSSAYQQAAPEAINRDTSLQRQGVTDTFGTNYRNLKTAEEDATLQYDRFNRDLTDRRNSATSALKEGLLSQRQQLQGSLADIARQRAAVQGKGVGGINAAGAPYQTQVGQSQAAIDGLFNQYRTPYAGIQAVNVQAPNLSDYTVDRASVNAQAQSGGTTASPYAAFLKNTEDDKLF